MANKGMLYHKCISPQIRIPLRLYRSMDYETQRTLVISCHLLTDVLESEQRRCNHLPTSPQTCVFNNRTPSSSISIISQFSPTASYQTVTFNAYD